MGTSQQNSTVDASMGVRERLLAAAEELFSERGFDGTSVRELAAAAGCNVASVNYYFGGKEKLYVELWRRHLVVLRETRAASVEKVMSAGGGKPELEDLLRSFANAFIGPLVEEGAGRRLMRLMAREMVESHLPANMFGKEVIEPTLSLMQSALSKACPELEASKIPLIVFSLVGQLLHTVRVKIMMECFGDEALAMFEPGKVVDHIVSFTAGGIRGYAGGRGE